VLFCSLCWALLRERISLSSLCLTQLSLSHFARPALRPRPRISNEFYKLSKEPNINCKRALYTLKRDLLHCTSKTSVCLLSLTRCDARQHTATHCNILQHTADYSQYSPEGGFVDSVAISRESMQQFALSRRITLTLEIPPGDSTIIIRSVVLAYPHTEA